MSDEAKSLTTTFNRGPEKVHSVVYQAIPSSDKDKPVVASSVYLSKAALQKIGNPLSLTITITAQ